MHFRLCLLSSLGSLGLKLRNQSSLECKTITEDRPQDWAAGPAAGSELYAKCTRMLGQARWLIVPVCSSMDGDPR